MTVGIQLLWLLGASEALALTPEEADRAIQRGLESQSIRSARDFYEITKFSSREAMAQRHLMGARSGHEYTLLIRGFSVKDKRCNRPGITSLQLSRSGVSRQRKWDR